MKETEIQAAAVRMGVGIILCFLLWISYSNGESNGEDRVKYEAVHLKFATWDKTGFKWKEAN
jgi:hypothetical protein